MGTYIVPEKRAIILSLFFKARPDAQICMSMKNSFAYERLCYKTGFEKEVPDNSEIYIYIKNYQRQNHSDKPVRSAGTCVGLDQ